MDADGNYELDELGGAVIEDEEGVIIAPGYGRDGYGGFPPPPQRAPKPMRPNHAAGGRGMAAGGRGVGGGRGMGSGARRAVVQPAAARPPQHEAFDSPYDHKMDQSQVADHRVHTPQHSPQRTGAPPAAGGDDDELMAAMAARGGGGSGGGGSAFAEEKARLRSLAMPPGPLKTRSPNGAKGGGGGGGGGRSGGGQEVFGL